MIILKEKVAGYNKVLTLATKDMKFGVNENVNYVKPEVTKVQQQQQEKVTKVQQQPEVTKVTATTVFPKIDKTTYLLGSMATVGFLVAKYVI